MRIREKSRGGEEKKTANQQWKLFYYKDAVWVLWLGRRKFSCLNGTQQVVKCKLLRATRGVRREVRRVKPN
jgi:hypothetical protein